MPDGRCRFCDAPLTETFVDLGKTPLSNAFLTREQLDDGDETFFPLHAWVCSECLLVQLEAFETPDNIFGDYAYFSSCSDSWLEHCRRYVAEMIPRLRLGSTSRVVELASNDGYLLQYFVEKHIPVLGIEPAANVAEAARAKGVPTEVVFFGVEAAQALREKGTRADLLIGNNVLAHVPDLNDFVAGMGILLAQSGTITMEFPHLLRLIEQNQFDTIYHEHFSYFSLHTAEKVFAKHGLRIYDVQELPTHGGSLRIFACHGDNESLPTTPAVAELKHREEQFGLLDLKTYKQFPEAVKTVCDDLLRFLHECKADGKNVLGYGAPAKGNTLLNACNVTEKLLPFTVDRNVYKQGRYLPGTHIPIRRPEDLLAARPDYVLILPWNLRREISEQLKEIRSWGGRFVVPIPRLEVW
jgi:SAM-dependent methyltransferase